MGLVPGVPPVTRCRHFPVQNSARGSGTTVSADGRGLVSKTRPGPSWFPLLGRESRDDRGDRVHAPAQVPVGDPEFLPPSQQVVQALFDIAVQHRG